MREKNVLLYSSQTRFSDYLRLLEEQCRFPFVDKKTKTTNNLASSLTSTEHNKQIAIYIYFDIYFLCFMRFWAFCKGARKKKLSFLANASAKALTPPHPELREQTFFYIQPVSYKRFFRRNNCFLL